MTDVLDIRLSSEAVTPSQPKQERKPLTLAEISDVASRLGRLLAQESHFLSNMKIKEVAKLQDEKKKLVAALEIQKKILRLDPSIKKGFSEEEIKDFENVSLMFDDILKENYRQLLRTKEVNRKVVEIIAKAVMDHVPVAAAYSRGGMAAMPTLQHMPLSFSQNA